MSCDPEKAHAYYEANREHHAELVHAWYEANKDRKAALSRAHYQTNKENRTRQMVAWVAANPERNRLNALLSRGRRRMSRKRELIVQLEVELESLRNG